MVIVALAAGVNPHDFCFQMVIVALAAGVNPHDFIYFLCFRIFWPFGILSSAFFNTANQRWTQNIMGPVATSFANVPTRKYSQVSLNLGAHMILATFRSQGTAFIQKMVMLVFFHCFSTCFRDNRRGAQHSCIMF